MSLDLLLKLLLMQPVKAGPFFPLGFELVFSFLQVSGCRYFYLLLWPNSLKTGKATGLSWRQVARSPTSVKLSQALQLYIIQAALQELMLHVQSSTKLEHVSYTYESCIYCSSSHELMVIKVVRDSCPLQSHVKILYHHITLVIMRI
jgi:hypothetical protein